MISNLKHMIYVYIFLFFLLHP